MDYLGYLCVSESTAYIIMQAALYWHAYAVRLPVYLFTQLQRYNRSYVHAVSILFGCTVGGIQTGTWWYNRL